MKAVVYSIKSYEKEYLAKANQKKHEITLIANALSLETTNFAEGKDVVIVSTTDHVSADVVSKLKSYGIKYIATRSTATEHINREAASAAGIKIANVPNYLPQSMAEQAITLILALNTKVNLVNTQPQILDIELNNLQGYSLHGKTIGLIGFGDDAKALAQILNGFGCKILVYDPFVNHFPKHVISVCLNDLLSKSSIISLNVPLNKKTHFLINQNSIARMQNGVMLINSSSSLLIHIADVINALKSGKIGYYGAIVCENENDLFFGRETTAKENDPVLQQLISLPNFMITPNQVSLSQNALYEIANKTIQNLDRWQKGKCVGKACACANSCQKNLVKQLQEIRH